jgi:hypothetical protein
MTHIFADYLPVSPDVLQPKSAMAGLEIAGVVLRSLPLIINALEHYSEGVRINLPFYESIPIPRGWVHLSTTERPPGSDDGTL